MTQAGTSTWPKWFSGPLRRKPGGREWCQALVFSLGPGLRVMSGPGGGPGCALTVWVTGPSDVPAEPGLRARRPRGSRWACAQDPGELLPPQTPRRSGPGLGAPSRVSLMWGAAGCAQDRGDPARAQSSDARPRGPSFPRLPPARALLPRSTVSGALAHHGPTVPASARPSSSCSPTPGSLVSVQGSRLQTGRASHCPPPPMWCLRASLDLPRLPCLLYSQNPAVLGCRRPGGTAGARLRQKAEQDSEERQRRGRGGFSWFSVARPSLGAVGPALCLGTTSPLPHRGRDLEEASHVPDLAVTDCSWRVGPGHPTSACGGRLSGSVSTGPSSVPGPPGRCFSPGVSASLGGTLLWLSGGVTPAPLSPLAHTVVLWRC